MDYVPGSIAALISGNVTPNGPKITKRAFTPIKHQPSPNVTPKSETVIDRSIFLSPTLQKKKAIIKKSPKRIFQTQDFDITNDDDTSLLTKIPDVDKAKKRLKNDLEAEISSHKGAEDKNSSKKQQVKSGDSPSPKKTKKNDIEAASAQLDINTPRKKKRNSVVENTLKECEDKENADIKTTLSLNVENQSPKKKNNKLNSVSVTIVNSETKIQTDNESVTENMNVQNGNKSLKRKKSKSERIENEKLNAEQNSSEANTSIVAQTETENAPKKAKKRNKRKKKSKLNNQTELNLNQENDNNNDSTQNGIETKSKKDQKKNRKIKSYVNPNAITNKDTDSEHESDNEIESENEEINKKILEKGLSEESSDEEEEEVKKAEKKVNESIKPTNDEIKRTIFVGNVLFSKKCKKEMKKIFSKHGTIETIRIRTIPVKDARVTPKLAVIKNELHPDRSTVNVYIKYADESSVDKALVENNTILNELHLRVSRSDHTGEDHDPRCSIFVGNMPFALEDEALRTKFEKCGEIQSVRIIRDRKTNAGKGFGYVNFTSKDGVELALAMSEEDLTMKNRILRVKRCTQLTNKGGTNRNQGGNNSANRKQGGNNSGNRYQGGNNPANRNQGGNNFKRKFPGGTNFGNRQGNEESKSGGAYRRIMNKRENRDASEGPPNKRPRNINQPKEKKVRKEYVGLTAEKKKKQKVAKGQKKKKALSEILTKKT